MCYTYIDFQKKINGNGITGKKEPIYIIERDLQINLQVEFYWFATNNLIKERLLQGLLRSTEYYHF
jgi:hypothetical protein